MKRLIFILPCLFALGSIAQTVSKSFEMRYFTNDPKADGETDLKGETEWMNTDQRIHFLNDYAAYASRFFGNPGFDQEIVDDQEVREALAHLKPQPLTNIRRTIRLNGWKAYGYKEGEESERQEELDRWKSIQGVNLSDGILQLNDAVAERKIDSLNWRFRFDVKVDAGTGECVIVTRLDGFRFRNVPEGTYVVSYEVTEHR